MWNNPLKLKIGMPFLCLIFVIGWHSSSSGEIRLIESGPLAGRKAAPLSVAFEDGRVENLEQWMGTHPGALLFVHELTRNTAPMIRQMDILSGQFHSIGFRGRVIFLQGDRTEGLDMLRRVGGSLKPAIPFSVSVDGLEGPGSYALNRTAALTLVLFRDGHILKSYGMTDVGPQDLDMLKDWMDSTFESIPASPEEFAARSLENFSDLSSDEEKMEFLRIQSYSMARLQRLADQSGYNNNMGNARGMRPQTARRNPQAQDMQAENSGVRDNQENRNTSPAQAQGQEKPQRQGRPPEDPELNSLLRQFIRKTHSDSEIDGIFSKIDARAGVSAELETEAVEMFKLMLSFPDRYGTSYAQDKAKAFLETHSKP